MNFIPLISIPLIFVIVALLKPYVQIRLPMNVCAICIAVVLTWALLLLLMLGGTSIDPLLIGVLMGMSVTGIMYKVEAFYKSSRLKHFWFARLLIILGGYYFVVLLLQQKWSLALLLGIGVLTLLVIVSFLLQGVTHEDAVRNAPFDPEKKSLLKKLDNCC